jgi:hypothetical protein
MRVRLNDPRLYPALDRYFRVHAYLVVRKRDWIEVVPINAVGEHADRARLERDLEAWLAWHPDIEATVDES